MLNTCSIGRRWKPREGWSRPVLTGERGTLFPTRLLGRVSSCGGFFRWMARSIVSCGHDDDTGEAFLLASVVRFPDRHDRNRSCGMVPVLPADPCGWPLYWFCGGHGPGETPGPFPNPEAKAWHGDGTALERVWESSAPPHSTLGVPVELRLREPPFFYALLCRPAGRSTLPGVPVGPFPLLGVRIIPRAGRPRTPRDFRNFRGASCAYPMVE